jgi:hypothetical protein
MNLIIINSVNKRILFVLILMFLISSFVLEFCPECIAQMTFFLSKENTTIRFWLCVNLSTKTGKSFLEKKGII